MKPLPQTAKILLVDDQRESLVALEAALERPGYEFVRALSGEEALLALLRDEFAVILLDVAMPGLDGFETATLIRDRPKTRETPIIFFTGEMTDVNAMFRGYDAGAVDYLLKPLDPHALRTKVAVFVALWRQQHEIERTAEALRAAEARERHYVEALYDVTFEEAPVGMGHATQDGRWLRVNERLASILGRNREALLSTSLMDLVHDADREVLLANVSSVVSGRAKKHRGEYRLVRDDGATVSVVLTMVLIRGRNGEAVQLAIIEDNSEEKRLGVALAASEWRFARLCEMGVIGIFHEAPDGTITEANDAFLNMIGCSHEDVGARRVRAEALLAPGSKAAKIRATKELGERGACETYEVEYRRKDGGAVSAIVGAVAGVEPGFVCFALDVTAIKQQDRVRARVLADLRESVLARDEFLFIAAHELRNPLTPLVVQLHNLRGNAMRSRSAIDPAWLARQLEPAERAANRLAKLIERLLEVARVIAGGVPLELKRADVVEIVRGVVGRMEPEIKRARSDVTVHASELAVIGRWDSMRIEEVVSDLLENALKYGAGSPIEIDIGADDRAARFSVTDHGIGISHEDQDRIFERFGRAVPLHHYGGFGLGLWMARRIVEAHGGRIQLESEMGKGARFTVMLPKAGGNDAHLGC